jgi:hypothetical protein
MRSCGDRWNVIGRLSVLEKKAIIDVSVGEMLTSEINFDLW